MLMQTRLILIANGVISGLAVYLLVVYGKLHWWFRAARQSGFDASQTGNIFFSAADQLPVIAIALAGLMAFANFALWKSKLVGSRWGILFFAFSLICLILSLVIRF
jgi:hypothetical protein